MNFFMFLFYLLFEYHIERCIICSMYVMPLYAIAL